MPQRLNYDTFKLKKVLRDFRIDNAWTHDRAAQYWGIERPLYSQYETGKTRIPLEFCLMVCQNLNLNLNDYVSRI